MYDRFSDVAKRSMNLALQEAKRLRHDYISAEHVLLGLIGDDNNSASSMLVALGVDRTRLRDALLRSLLPGQAEGPVTALPFWPNAKRTLERAMDEAERLQDNYIGTVHLLLGLSAEGTSIGARALTDAGVSLEQLRKHAKTLVDSERYEVTPLRYPTIDQDEKRAEIIRLLSRAEALLHALNKLELANDVSRVSSRVEWPAREAIAGMLELLKSARNVLLQRSEDAAARAVLDAIRRVEKQG
jgi:ATP-dependent Clp protease ATP-binding subunit ClpA